MKRMISCWPVIMMQFLTMPCWRHVNHFSGQYFSSRADSRSPWKCRQYTEELDALLIFPSWKHTARWSTMRHETFCILRTMDYCATKETILSTSLTMSTKKFQYRWVTFPSSETMRLWNNPRAKLQSQPCRTCTREKILCPRFQVKNFLESSDDRWIFPWDAAFQENFPETQDFGFCDTPCHLYHLCSPSAQTFFGLGLGTTHAYPRQYEHLNNGLHNNSQVSGNTIHLHVRACIAHNGKLSGS